MADTDNDNPIVTPDPPVPVTEALLGKAQEALLAMWLARMRAGVLTHQEQKNLIELLKFNNIQVLAEASDDAKELANNLPFPVRDTA